MSSRKKTDLTFELNQGAADRRQRPVRGCQGGETVGHAGDGRSHGDESRRARGAGLQGTLFWLGQRREGDGGGEFGGAAQLLREARAQQSEPGTFPNVLSHYFRIDLAAPRPRFGITYSTCWTPSRKGTRCAFRGCGRRWSRTTTCASPSAKPTTTRVRSSRTTRR